MRVTVGQRLRAALRLLARTRRHELRAARSWLALAYGGLPPSRRLLRFARWTLDTLWRAIPNAAQWARYERRVSRTPVWLREPNPFENHPWRAAPAAQLPPQVEVVVIGAGLVGAAAAYHWSRLGQGHAVVLEMHAPAAGAGGRNAGVVTMGRYYYYVHDTVSRYLSRARRDLSRRHRDARAHRFAAAYVRAAYENHRAVRETIAREGIECDYVRRGWVWSTDADSAAKPAAAAAMGRAHGFHDWSALTPQEALQRGGIRGPFPAGYSAGAGTWNPARWIWGLFEVALRSPQVELYTRTRVLKLAAEGDGYRVVTDRGTLRARYVLNATESHTAALFPAFHGVIRAGQSQAAWGPSRGGSMRRGVALSSPQMFFGSAMEGTLVGSDMSLVPDREAGANRPSRFITSFVLAQMRRLFGIDSVVIRNEWSGTVGMTPDEYPVIGRMDDRGLYIVGGMAGSGSGVAFLGARHVICQMLGIAGPDYYPEELFSPRRFDSPPPG